MKRFYLLLMLILAGCGTKNALTPKDTLVGSGSRSNDFIFESEVYDKLPDRTGQGLYNPADVVASVYFDFDQSSLKPEQRLRIETIAKTLKGDAQLLIAGHCDWFGTEEYNIGLGERRANSVLSYIKQIGVQTTECNVVSRGSLDSQKGLSKVDAYKDRRADIVLKHK
ncbi:MAG: hypothetical protein A2Y14_00335 [Verrucomicrobia bacterium GWF2_51_19]|nr:MAG: hypothetical protein A2Y14_00335 [Verrucomicrobia bacterium GWF2_51_19]